MENRKAVLLISGGVNSAVLLAFALKNKVEPHCLTVDYGQNAAGNEMQAAKSLVEHYVTDQDPSNRWRIERIDPTLFPPSSLTLPPYDAAKLDSVVNTKVKGRNLVFIAHAVCHALKVGAEMVMVGFCDGRCADERKTFLDAMRTACNAAYGVTLWAPFLKYVKADVLRLGRSLKAPIVLTWSCYRGGENQCGRCLACVGLKEAREIDDDTSGLGVVGLEIEESQKEG